MGGTFSKKRGYDKSKSMPHKDELNQREQRLRMHSGTSIPVKNVTALTRVGSELSWSSPSSRKTGVIKSSCGNVAAIKTEHLGRLKRTNNSSPSFSTRVPSLGDVTNETKMLDTTHNIMNNTRPTSLKSVNQQSRTDMRKEKLRWKDVTGQLEDEFKSCDSKLIAFSRENFGGDSSDRQNISLSDYDNNAFHGELSLKSTNCPFSTYPTASAPSVKSSIDLNQSEYLGQPSTGGGDVNISQPIIAKRKNATDTQILTNKPPTPPPKTKALRAPIASRRTLIPASRRYSDPTRLVPNSRQSVSPSPIVSNATPRTSSLTRTPHADTWIRLPRAKSNSLSLSNPSAPDTESEAKTERPTCLSRIEYTFYINDTDENQRPFYDRRIEAVAKASQCNICLHKPAAGCKSVYYKGNRVLPVTISTRTMIALKRCIARLDIQYPHYNVKAFCPPDMY